MISVIADDITGAAELGGVGLRYGLTVEINTEVPDSSDVNLMIIQTDTRLLSSEEAYKKVYETAKSLYALGVKWIYKKTDSVLRGHIGGELEAFSKASNKNKILFIPANPSFGRIIKDGIYFIKGELLHESHFSEDPEFAVETSDLMELIKPVSNMRRNCVKDINNIAENTISIGEVSNINDLKYWAKNVNRNILLSGASEFFTALLEAEGYNEINNKDNEDFKPGKNRLFVQGSSYYKNRIFLSEAKKKGYDVCEIPNELFNQNHMSEKFLIQWADEVIKSYKTNSKVIITINKPIIRDIPFGKQLRNYISEVVEKVFCAVEINELFIEGGATAASLIERLKFNKLIPIQELALGVIRFTVEKERRRLCLTIKPGSYSWPGSII